jgi:hypothetical protein
MSAWPSKKEISIHEYHEFDQEYCYDCGRCMDSDKYPEDRIAIGNTVFNTAHTECSKSAIYHLTRMHNNIINKCELTAEAERVINHEFTTAIETIRGRM